MSYIFTDPAFIRKNTLLNFIHSTFPADEVELKVVVGHSDLLRAYYHALSLDNSKTVRIDFISIAYSAIHYCSDLFTEIDWFYSERIVLHFANLNRFKNRPISFLLGRY